MSAQQIWQVSRKTLLIWKLAFIRLGIYIFVSVASEFLVATYNVTWDKMDNDQRIAVFISLAMLAGNILLSFLDQSIKTIESGGDLPPDLPQKTTTTTAVQQTQVTETKP